MELTQTPNTAGSYAATTRHCVAPLSETANWTIEAGQIRLLAGEDGPVITALGGNQFRISGDLADSTRSVILERANGDAKSQAIRTAIATYRCIYRGFSSDCAAPDELAKPETPAVRTIVNLNVRAQPRFDAPVIGVVPRDTEITVEECLVPTDGFWCEARFGASTGLFTRTALREDTCPILTFVEAD
ncbi:SH3 domain-containing protein [Jannaschia seohaensis]|uniref:SH3 domain-containing protein n=1 Tax=Jannaschia seohaensis TaxID=475081 RepID=A0A2Y9C8T5_9RHOB|nr:SH3 domain-containing protein [Jannaschia seohaensis]PWJ14465.1 hypothetical protein BCF38_11288 [Jannaschia seohaensis]SSA50213.1 hypothetical protein SAMN05421539_11288 [Jannaschia seohaensis]